MLRKVSNKKCNGSSPHSSSGEGHAPRGLSKPPLSVLTTTGSIRHILSATQKKETEVSLSLSNFVLLKCITT